MSYFAPRLPFLPTEELCEVNGVGCRVPASGLRALGNPLATFSRTTSAVDTPTAVRTPAQLNHQTTEPNRVAQVHPRFKRDALGVSSRREDPLTRSDFLLDSRQWSSLIVGKISEVLRMAACVATTSLADRRTGFYICKASLRKFFVFDQS